MNASYPRPALPFSNQKCGAKEGDPEHSQGQHNKQPYKNKREEKELLHRTSSSRVDSSRRVSTATLLFQPPRDRARTKTTEYWLKLGTEDVMQQ
ncbi:hypothetical protein [Sphingomonas sp.]|uniref:hypothetical protein n=1 Tax=Sphingomonas sp. TaxID=28214 RepID=UPI002603C897|nr:hypothetical protein [Sphingomonas sp.]